MNYIYLHTPKAGKKAYFLLFKEKTAKISNFFHKNSTFWLQIKENIEIPLVLQRKLQRGWPRFHRNYHKNSIYLPIYKKEVEIDINKFDIFYLF